MKKRLSMLFAFILCAGLLCIGAWAATGDTVTVAGLMLSGASPYAKADENGNVEIATAEDYNISWDESSNTLTLNNASISYQQTGNAISASGELNIALAGENSINCNERAVNFSAQAGAENTLAFTGTGSLEINSGTEGIYASMSNIVIDDCTLKVTAGARGIVAMDSREGIGKLTIRNGADVTVKANETSYDESHLRNDYDAAIWSNAIEISGNSLVDVEGKFDGIFSQSTLTVRDSTVEAMGEYNGFTEDGQIYHPKFAIKTYGNIYFENSTVNAVTNGSVTANGIHTESGIYISGSSDITADGGIGASNYGVTVDPPAGTLVEVKIGTKENGEEGARHFEGSPYSEQVTFSGENELGGYTYAHIKPHTHTGSGATCISLAVCSDCGREYGEFDSSNHTGTVVWTKTSTTHSGYYDCCGAAVSEAEHTFENGVCTVCGYEQLINIPDTYDIELIAGEGGEASTSLTNASAGSTVTVSVTPDEGYELDYITVDGERIDGTSFTMPGHDVTVRVYFKEIGAAMPFVDVAAGAWYYDAVSYVWSNGLMEGTSATTFEPDTGMTRAMVWAVLARMDGQSVSGASWMETARSWAMSEGVSDGTDPNSLITREQLATMLYRYAGSPAVTGNGISAFTDAASVSSWAVDAMNWALEQGIITGMGDGTLSPQGTATRAQAAAMLMRFVERKTQRFYKMRRPPGSFERPGGFCARGVPAKTRQKSASFVPQSGFDA